MGLGGTVPKKELAPGSRANYEELAGWGDAVEIGPDVIIECQRLSVGNGVKIGSMDSEIAFRHPGGIRIRVRDLVLEDGVQIDRETLIEGGRIALGRRSHLGAGNTVRVKKQFNLGAGGMVADQCEISGVDIAIGRNFRMLSQAKIGGGSSFEVQSRLRLGHWCHIGSRALLNTARPITVGHEVGLGTSTCLYTHGAYPSALDGKPAAFGPISVGDRTWIPGAIVNPSVSIGKDCVIAVGSVVSRDIPDGCLAGGVPAVVIRENMYPRPMTGRRRLEFLTDFVKVFSELCSERCRTEYRPSETSPAALIGQTLVQYVPALSGEDVKEWQKHGEAVAMTDDLALAVSELPKHVTVIDLTRKRIVGPATPVSERLADQLRRYGIRFNYESEGGQYVPWDEESPTKERSS